MITTHTYNNKTYRFDLSKPIDISIPLRAGKKNVSAWYVPPVRIEPVVMGDWIGDVNQGGSVNFRNIYFNPHGHGTHTECIGHISKENYTINQCLKKFFFMAEVISISQGKIDGDSVITKTQLDKKIRSKKIEALIIRTLPNPTSKLVKQYSSTNPAYIDSKAMKLLKQRGIRHLMVDTPSVDKEKDDGKLLSHHAFWEYPKNKQLDKTITEMIYVPQKVKDGIYLLNIQIASFENDASPSKPVLFTPLYLDPQEI